MEAFLRALMLAGGLTAGILPDAALAQSYPSKTVTLVAPTAPGGVIDRICRMLAARFADHWKAQVVLEHRPGANN